LNAALEQKLKASQESEAEQRLQAQKEATRADAEAVKAREQQKLAEELRLRAERERDHAQKQAQVAEAQRQDALKAAQALRDAFEQKLKTARQREEEARALAEQRAEQARVDAEQARVDAEQARAQAERAAKEEAKARALAERREAEARNAPKADLEATKKYQKAVAEHFLQAVLARNGRGLGGTLSKELQTSIGEGKVQTWMAELHPEHYNYRDAKFDPEQTAPGGEETVLTGVLSGSRLGRFSIRVVKDKESGHYVIDSASVVEMPR
jgi:hypothetical protein